MNEGHTFEATDKNEATQTTSSKPSIGEINSIKILKDIRSLGCSKEDIAAATYRIYLDLCEVRKYHSASYDYLEELDLLYISVKKFPESETEIVVPLTTTRTLNFIELERLQKLFSRDEVSLAICDPSSVIMYYKVTSSR